MQDFYTSVEAQGHAFNKYINKCFSSSPKEPNIQSSFSSRLEDSLAALKQNWPQLGLNLWGPRCVRSGPMNVRMRLLRARSPPPLHNFCICGSHFRASQSPSSLEYESPCRVIGGGCDGTKTQTVLSDRFLFVAAWHAALFSFAGLV